MCSYLAFHEAVKVDSFVFYVQDDDKIINLSYRQFIVFGSYSNTQLIGTLSLP